MVGRLDDEIQGPDITGGVHVNKEDIDVDTGDQGIVVEYNCEEMDDASHALDGNSLG